MTGSRDCIEDYQQLPERYPVRVGNGEYLYATGIGSIPLVSTVGKKEYKLRLNDVLYIPNIVDNLFSIGAA